MNEQTNKQTNERRCCKKALHACIHHLTFTGKGGQDVVRAEQNGAVLDQVERSGYELGQFSRERIQLGTGAGQVERSRYGEGGGHAGGELSRETVKFAGAGDQYARDER